MFSARYGVPADINYYRWIEQAAGMKLAPNRKLLAWTPREEPSNCPNIASHMHKFAKLTSWQLHSVIRNVFVGRIPSLQAAAVAKDTIGQAPFTVAISDGLYTAGDQCVYLWESSVRLMGNAEADLLRGLDIRDVLLKLHENISVRGLEDRVDKVINYLRYTLCDGNPAPLVEVKAEDIELPVLGVPGGDLRHRPRRQFCWQQFVIAHELSHILLGHLGPTGSSKASQYAYGTIHNYRTLSTWDMLINDSQRTEAEADLFGFWELCYTTSWESSRRKGVSAGWRDRSQLALLVQHLEGVAIATLTFYLLSALGIPEHHSSTHPHPDYRLALITEAVLERMKTIISGTSEPDKSIEGLDGFYERTLYIAERIPRIYQTITYALELALNRR